jgi:hypothetical protein
MNSKSKSSTVSLKWAIDELSKQKRELKSKLSIAQKRDDTSSLIEEVNAQKKALEKRISSLEEGFRASTELVDEPVANLTEELEKIDDKLEIAQDRLNTLEQEEYLEELGRKLNGDFANEASSVPEPSQELALHGQPPSLSAQDVQTSTISESIVSSDSKSQKSLSPTPVLMKSTTNRIESEKEVEETPTRLPSSTDVSSGTSFEHCSPETIKSLDECAAILGMEPDYLLNKGMQAVLRMIARNGNKLSFPLEVEQIEKG